MLVVTVVGARPQLVKAAVVSVALAAAGVDEALVHTGQHFDDAMSGRFFADLGMAPPACNLGIVEQTHGAMTGRMLQSIEGELLERRPDAVIVHGDTNSTLAGALAAVKLHIPVAHVEAGLRSFNRAMPEEVNRVVTDHVSDLLLAPTDAAVANLAAEGIAGASVVRTGDVMLDAALRYGDRAAAQSTILADLDLAATPYALVTIHRAENTDDDARLTTLFDALEVLAHDLAVVVPLHPRTRAALGDTARWPTVRCTPPVGYLDMVALERGATVVVTDSGGVQKEAYFHAVPCVTVRAETEWVELVEAGWNRLAPPTSVDRVVDAVRAAASERPTAHPPLYGSGDAASTIAAAVRALG